MSWDVVYVRWLWLPINPVSEVATNRALDGGNIVMLSDAELICHLINFIQNDLIKIIGLHGTLRAVWLECSSTWAYWII